MGRLRPLKICIKICAIAALGLAYFPESMAVPVPRVREAPSLDGAAGRPAVSRSKHFLIYR